MHFQMDDAFIDALWQNIFSQDLLIYGYRVTDFGRKGFIINHN